MLGIKIALLLLAASQTDEGIAAFNQGRYSEAIAKLKDSRDAAGRLYYALAQAGQGDCKTALPELEQAPGRVARLAAAKCESALGDTNRALALLAALAKQFPDDPDILYLTAKLDMKAFNDATLVMFERTPSSYRVHELSAEIFEVENRYADAAAEYRKAIEISPRAADLHYRLGRALLLASHDRKALDEAAAAFKAELAISPEDSASEYQLGQIALNQGDSGAAKPHFERALQLSPDFVQAMIALAKLSTHEQAVGLLTRAVELQPANESAHYALLTAYRNAGQMDKAKAEKATLDKLQKPPDGEFSDFLKKLGEKPAPQ